MLNWQGWAQINFLGWGAEGVTPEPPVLPNFNPKPGGGGKEKRRKIVLDDKVYDLSPGELQQVLSLVLSPVKSVPKAIAKPVKALRKVVEEAPKVAEPTYAMAPAFDILWEHFAKTRQREAQEALRLAMEIEQDDMDIFSLLMKIKDE